MMNKTKSARVHLIRFLFLLPLLIVVLLAFRNTTQEHRQPLPGTVTDTIPNAAKTPPGWKDMNTINVTDEQQITIRLKNGKTERYDLKNSKDKTEFEKKYGALPQPPSPPAILVPDKELPEAPEKPERPEKQEARELQEAPEAPEAPEKVEVPEAPEAPEKAEVPEVPVPPTVLLQDCLNKKGYCITVADNYGECIVIIKDKNNKIVEAVALTDWNKDKQYEAKYGEIPQRPIRINIRLQPKVTTGFKINAKPNPVKVVNGKPINKAETIQSSSEKATPVAVNIKIEDRVDAKPVASVKSNSAVRVRVASTVSVKSAAKVQVAAEPKAIQKPVPAQPDDKL